MSLLMDRWSRACDDQGQAVLLAGLCRRVPAGSAPCSAGSFAGVARGRALALAS